MTNVDPLAAARELLDALMAAYPGYPRDDLVAVASGLVLGTNTVLLRDRKPMGELYRLATTATQLVGGAKTVTLTPATVRGRNSGDVIPLETSLLILFDLGRFLPEFLAELIHPLGGGSQGVRGVLRGGRFEAMPDLLAVYAVLDTDDRERASLHELAPLFSAGVCL